MKHHWQKQRQQADHIDDWLMTYADVITLLLCFFAVYLTVALAHKQPPPTLLVPQPVQQIVEAEPAPPPPPPPSQPVWEKMHEPDFLEGNLPLHGVDHAEGPTGDSTERVESEPVAPAVSLPEAVDRLKTQGEASIEQQGDRITSIDVNSAAFFESGSATLSKAGAKALHDVAVMILSDQYKDYQVTVEGHTDDSPIKTTLFPSNWELSTARAAAVVHYFIERGVPAQKLRAAGYADTFPKVPNRDAEGKPLPANQAQNRRVVIKLEKVEKRT